MDTATQFIHAISFMEHEAIEVYRQCPKIIAIFRHADLTDDSEFHCIWSGTIMECGEGGKPETRPYEIKKVFLVPRQRLRFYTDCDGLGEYLAIRVRPQFEVKLYPRDEFWLFVRRENLTGFLVPLEADIGHYEMLGRQKSAGLQQALCSNAWFSEGQMA